MATLEFKLPDVGEGLAQGEIVRWHAAPGDEVRADKTLVEVETDKAIVEIPSPTNGILKSVGAAEGESLAVGAVLATFEVHDVELAKPNGSEAVSATPKSPTTESRASSTGRVLASPAVRKAAREAGVDLATLHGSGSRGQITQVDLKAAISSSVIATRPASKTEIRSMTPAPQGADRVEPLRGLRRRIAQTMERAWREVPHIFNTQEIDATQLVAARDALNNELSGTNLKLSYMPFFVKACIKSLQRHPSFNASIDTQKERIVYRHRYNIGFATATENGLMVPVLHDANRFSLCELSGEITSLARLARDRKATVEQLSHGTFTISNFGTYGTGMGMPIIRPPEAAIAGFGRIRDGVLAENGQAVVRPVLPVVVSTDHRLNDGAELGAFLSTLTTYLSEPIRLLSEA